MSFNQIYFGKYVLDPRSRLLDFQAGAATLKYVQDVMIGDLDDTHDINFANDSNTNWS